MRLKQFLDSLNAEQLVDRLNLALDGATLGIWDWDLRDNSVQFDRRWCDMLGIDHATMPMELDSWESRVHPDDLADCYADITAYLNGETDYYENVHRMKHVDGHWVYILDRGRVSGWDEEGNAIRFTGTHFDCTATERANRVLEQQRELLADMIHDMPSAVAMFDLEGRYVTASAKWRQLHRLSDESYEGKEPGVTGLELPPEWDEARRNASAAKTATKDAQIVQLGGDLAAYRWSTRPWRSAGAVAGVIIQADDISAFIQERQNREEESRLSVLGLMAGGVAHELNTPLQSILLNCQMSGSELESPEPDLSFLRECNAEVLETLTHMDRIVRALRTMSRDGAKDPLGPVDAQLVVQDVTELCSARFRNRNVELEVVCDIDAETEIQARATDVGQILLNLLNNALDAVSGVANPYIQLRVRYTGAGLSFLVVDSGPGVPEDFVDELMSPFATSKPLGEGSGLGLTISRNLAENQGATLRYVADAPSTTFELYFPTYQTRQNDGRAHT